MRRFVALSSTTSTRNPSRAATGAAGRAGGISEESRKRAVKWKVLPTPSSLSTHTRPSIKSTSAEEMANPEAGAAELTRGRAIGLFEGLEDDFLLVGRNADARIANGEMECHAVGVDRLAADGHNDLAAFGEFDGVADQIDHDLPQAIGIADDDRGHFGPDVVDQLEPLLVRRTASDFIVSPMLS